MDLGSWRPVLSGLVGGAIAYGLMLAWAKWIPAQGSDLSRDALLAEYRRPLQMGTLLSCLGIGLSLFAYGSGIFDRTDWRPVGFGFGFSLVSPVLVLLVASKKNAHGAREAFIVFAMSQKVPMSLACLFAAVGVSILIASLSALA